MSWLSLLITLIKIVNSLSKWMVNEQLISAGEARALVALMEDTNVRLSNAAKARTDSVADSQSGGLHDDDGHKRKS